MCQKEVGDVSCVVWDAALEVAKYLEARCNDMQDWLRGPSDVELDAGMGCVGLTAAFIGLETGVCVALLLSLCYFYINSESST